MSHTLWKVELNGEPTELTIASIPPGALETQQRYDEFTSQTCQKLRDAGPCEGWILRIQPNIGMNPSSISEIAKKNNGTCLKDMHFAKQRSFQKQLRYLLTTCPAGTYYLVGSLNPARCHEDPAERKDFSRQEYHFSVLLVKKTTMEGTIKTLTTSASKITILQYNLTENNIRWHFQDLYTLYYIAEDSLNSSTSKNVRDLLDRGKREQKQEEHRQKQAKGTFSSPSVSHPIMTKRKNRGRKRRRKETL